MKTTYLIPLCLLLCINGGIASRTKAFIGNKDGSEAWGYVEVRPKAHMFWWLYRSPYRVEDPSKPWPIILWIQGGPGGSAVGMGNFLEIGPLDASLNPRNSTWLKKADLLFVDSPVGTGYSFVEEKKLYVRSDEDAAKDLHTLLQEVMSRDERIRQSPIFLIAESYGGKIAVNLGLSILHSPSPKTKLRLGGVVLGNSWISPEDFVFSWGPLLNHVSRLDYKDMEESNSLAQNIKKQIEDGLYDEATSSWIDLETFISANSNSVDFYNFLIDSGMDPLVATRMETRKETTIKKYSNYLSSLRNLEDDKKVDFGTFMNGVIKKKLKIIPKDIIWGGSVDDVFPAMRGAFMRPTINEVNKLLDEGVNVTIYNGQLDLICSTSGVEAWVQKLKWKGLQEFMRKNREPIFCGDEVTRGFTKSHKNLRFYWILGAGHFVPVDQPCVALKMVEEITNSPAVSV